MLFVENFSERDKHLMYIMNKLGMAAAEQEYYILD